MRHDMQYTHTGTQTHTERACSKALDIYKHLQIWLMLAINEVLIAWLQHQLNYQITLSKGH